MPGHQYPIYENRTRTTFSEMTHLQRWLQITEGRKIQWSCFCSEKLSTIKQALNAFHGFFCNAWATFISAVHSKFLVYFLWWCWIAPMTWQRKVVGRWLSHLLSMVCWLQSDFYQCNVPVTTVLQICFLNNLICVAALTLISILSSAVNTRLRCIFHIIIAYAFSNLTLVGHAWKPSGAFTNVKVDHHTSSLNKPKQLHKQW